MARNKQAGKHSSYDKRGMSKTAIENKRKYDSEYQKSPDRVKYREELNAANRKAGTYGKKDGLDMSHGKDGSLKLEKQGKNRGRNGANGKSTKR